MNYTYECADKNSNIISVSNGKETIEFHMNQVGIAKKTFVIHSQIKQILTLTGKFNWYCKKLIEYRKNKNDVKIVSNMINDFLKIAKNYIIKRDDLDFNNFIDRKKITANTICIETTELKKLFILTIFLKLYSPFYASVERIDNYKHRAISADVIERLDAQKLLLKIYELVSVKIFKCSRDDMFLLQLVKVRSSVSEETFALQTFNFLVSSILVSFDLIHNPVTFIAASVGEMTKWFLKQLYSETTVYKENSVVLSNYVSLDVSNKIIYDDILRRVDKYVFERLKVKDVDLWEFQDNLDDVTENNFLKTFIIPMMSFLLKVPITILLDLKLEQKYKLQLFLYCIVEDLKDVISADGKKERSYLSDVLRQVIKNDKGSNYKCRNLDLIFSKNSEYYGLEHKTYLYKLISTVLSGLQKAKFKPLFGEEIVITPKVMVKIEKEIIPIIQNLLALEESDIVKSFRKYVENELLAIEI